MSDLQQYYDALAKADAAGDTAGAKQLADYIRSQGSPRYGSGAAGMMDAVNGGTVPSNSAAAKAAYSPASNSWLGNFGLATGESLHHLGQGIAQRFGDLTTSGAGPMKFLAGPSAATFPTYQDIQNQRALDAPLNAQPGSGWGRAFGTTLGLLPTAFIPGANTVAGAGVIGAATGFMQPSASVGETAKNTGIGGVGGMGGLLAGRGIAAAAQGVRGLIQPLFAGGQEDIASSTLKSFAGGDEASGQLASLLSNKPNVLPGIQPTTAELANNAGMSQFERTMRNNPDYLNAFTRRNQSNRAAMSGALDSIAGTDADMAAATAARSSASGPLYAQAREAQIVPDATLKNLLSRPSLSSAWGRAQQLASENGEALVAGKDIPATSTTHSMVTDFGSPYTTTTAAQSQSYSGRAIQYLKMALNDIANTGPQNGMGAHEVSAVKSTLGSLNEWIQGNVPQLKAADAAYAAASKPINQMEVGNALKDRLMPALSDFGNNTRVNANSFANAVRNGDQLAANATGWKGSTLEGTLTPSQMQTVMGVGQQLARRANADELGRAVGSNTAQNLASQNLLRNFLGPLGLPGNMAERAASSTLAQSIMRPAQWALSAGEPKIMDKLAQAALDPQEAARLLSMSNGNQALARALWERQGFMGLVGTQAGNALIGRYVAQ